MYLIGDTLGSLCITYANGVTDSVPLIYGYTLWWERPWNPNFRLPFAEGSREQAILAKTLHLKSALEGEYPYLLKIRLRPLPIASLTHIPNPDKEADWLEPQFWLDGITAGCSTSQEAGFDISDPEAFFETHTVDSTDPYPLAVREGIEQLRVILYTYEWDIKAVYSADIPDGYQGTRLTFKGTPEADILTSVFHHNLPDQLSRVEPDGLVRESNPAGNLYFHTGIGTWAENIGAYSSNYYTRNDTVQLLSDLGYLEQCERAIDFLDRQLMFFPENYPKLQLDGKPIPGHFTVVAENPLYYSHVLSELGGGLAWPTKYTKENIGEHYKDFGNPETDGHGHSMIACYKVWVKRGKDKDYVKKHWKYIVEAADYIGWHLDNPQLSFSENGLLYGETEAGLCDCSLQCNVPCYVGLLMYADMAESIGETEAASRWRTRADGLRKAIEAQFLNSTSDSPYWEYRVWLAALCNMITHFHKYYGNDLVGKMPAGWLEAAENTYQTDRKKRPHFIAPMGLGYDHNMYTQIALLLDHMEDSEKWIKNLARLCYAPRQPHPYIVPESAAVDWEQGIYHRSGDLGNGIQQSETLISLLLCAGVDNSDPSVLKIMPRLPDDFTLSMEEYPVTVLTETKSETVMLSYALDRPDPDSLKITLAVSDGKGIPNVAVRVGPFAYDCASVAVSVNGRQAVCVPEQHGDRSWVWLKDLAVEGSEPFVITASAKNE